MAVHRDRLSGDEALLNQRLTRLLLSLVVAASVAVVAATPASALRRAQFPVLSVGDRGVDVVAIQHLLRATGHLSSLSGYFGLETRSAVQSWQAEAGLPAHGIVDVATWESLVPRLAEGQSGEPVVALRKLLNAKRRVNMGVDGLYDSAVRLAVRDFQRHVDLPATGVVDLTTWRNLAWLYVRPDFRRPSLCNYDGGNYTADWGASAAVAQIEAAADLFLERTGERIGIGDISFWHGGPIVFHATHEEGLDVDVSLIRLDGRQCNLPDFDYRSRKYDGATTREMIRAIRETAGGHIKLIYFNDPVLVAEGLVQRYPRHDDHIHIRFCAVGHARALYVCPERSLQDYLGEGTPENPEARWEELSSGGAGYGG